MIGDIFQPTHLIFILVVALLVLGPKRLPGLGRSLGHGMREFKDAITGRSKPTDAERAELESQTTGSQNDSGYTNPRLDLILNNARKAASEKARRTLYRAAEKIILADRPLIYLYHPVTRAGLEKALQGVTMYPDTLLRVAFAQFK